MKKLLCAVLTIIVLASCISCSVYDRRPGPIEFVNIVDNVTKYNIDEFIPQSGKGELSVKLAKNEREGCQFILNFPQNVNNVSVNVSEITDGNGNNLNVYGVYREHYIENTPDAVSYTHLVAELADAPDLGSGVMYVGVQVPSSAPVSKKSIAVKQSTFFIYKVE